MSARRALALAVMVLVALPAASELRFDATTAGAVVATGNALGLSKQSNSNGPGIADSIGTFVSLDPESRDESPANPINPWPTGTTDDWTQNGSAAQLALPAGATVLYAELVWGGSTSYGGEDVRSALDTPVLLSAGAASISVQPDPATALTIEQTASGGFAANYYTRSADVTAFVAAHGATQYALEGVPATQATNINTLNAAGWTLLVAYGDPTQPIRALQLDVGGGWVDEISVLDFAFAGFCTPADGTVGGFAVASALEGDANFTGDALQIAESPAGPFAALSGPNNPATNFFASQINHAGGLLDTSGTFGTLNHDAANGTNVSGGRQGWDVTRVALSPANDQEGVVLRAITTGDAFVPVGAGIAIDVEAPDFRAASASADPTAIQVGETSVVTIAFENAGGAAANDISLTVPLPAGLVLDAFHTDGVPGNAHGAGVSAETLASGVDLGDLAPGASREATLTLRAVDAPEDAYILEPELSFAFASCPDGPAVVEARALDAVSIAAPEADAAFAALVALGWIARRRR